MLGLSGSIYHSYLSLVSYIVEFSDIYLYIYYTEVKYFSFKLEEMALNLLLYNLKGMNVFSFKFVYRYS